MKNLKKLIPALCLLLISAMLLGTSTFAWFSMSNTVTATGMKVTAKADSGIVIAVKADSPSYAAKADCQDEVGTEVYPASTVDLANWYYSASEEYDDASAGVKNTKGYTKVEGTVAADYYVQKDFLIKSSGAEILDHQIALKSVKATSTGTSFLDRAVRVGVKIGNTYYIYAPIALAPVTTSTEYVEGTVSEYTAPVKESEGNADTFRLTNDKIPAAENSVEVNVFIWFEGEDENCKSSNVTAELDTISVELIFEAIPVATEEPTEST